MERQKSCSSVTDRAKIYLSNTSIHGMRYLTDQESHFFERVFWFIICCLSFVGTYFLFVATWDTYVSNPISFVTETTYLDWNTTFPAVAVCEDESAAKISAFVTEIYGEDRNYNLDTFIGNILFGMYCSSCDILCGHLIPECPENIQEIITMFRAPCEELVSHCSWNDKSFECCSLFEKLETQLGTCYAINSMQTEKFSKLSKRGKSLPLVSNRIIGAGTLKFHINEAAVVHILAPEDVPFFNKPPSEFFVLPYGQKFSASFQVTEIVNDPMLEEVPVEDRKCRYPIENPFQTYPFYSYSACIVDCVVSEQIKVCGCLHHDLPHVGNLNGIDLTNATCDVKGLACLYKHDSHLRKIKSALDKADDKGMDCDCLASCTEPEYQIINTLKERILVDDATEVTIKMNALPTQRFIRNVVRTKLDLVVSMGGAAGLFLGASLLSIVEFIYYCCIRKKIADLPQSDGSKNVVKHVMAENEKMKNRVQQKQRALPGFYPRDYLPSYNIYL